MFHKILSLFKINLPNYDVPGATEKTHKRCPECDGSGRGSLFHDCENCGGTGLTKKSFKELHKLDTTR